ncbi:MAG: (Fe-S)-binding protein [Cyclobacteriaceae bacterium]|jgi:heterodisulfide reductase subunit C
MQILGQILFTGILLFTILILYRRIRFISSTIRLGKEQRIGGDTKRRWMNVLLIAFGQKKMFRRPIAAFLHLLIYAGFIIINLEVLEFIIDGLSGQHRFFAKVLQNWYPTETGYNAFYNILMNGFEVLTAGVIIACIIFLFRRNVLKIRRFTGIEMTRWPLLDANLILIFEIILMTAILTMNGADQALQNLGSEGYINTGTLYFSHKIIMPIVENMNAGQLIIIERFCWWFHIIGILGFAVYVTYSKHLHIVMAFPNTYFGNLAPPSTMDNMPEVMNEVKMMLGLQTSETGMQEEIARFGIKDITDLTWKNIMDAFTCTECGRCTSVCPANMTGKKLSPRKIIMDVRDRAEIIGRTGNRDHSGSLFDHVSKEEIFACTTCNACIDICPVSIDPVTVILGLRRYIAMEESLSPADWNMMFNNIETNFAPWKVPASDRFKWAESLMSDKK